MKKIAIKNFLSLNHQRKQKMLRKYSSQKFKYIVSIFKRYASTLDKLIKFDS